jgi:hypothetical protein
MGISTIVVYRIIAKGRLVLSLLAQSSLPNTGYICQNKSIKHLHFSIDKGTVKFIAEIL